MTPNKYQKLALRSEPQDYRHLHLLTNNSTPCKIIHSIMGINTESGELTDAAKKFFIYGQPFDIENFKEELGDLMWYIAIGASACGASLEDIMIHNIDKLKIRYTEKFTEQDAIERKDKKGGE